MDKYIKILKKLSILATLSSTTTESSILSGSIFTDTRTSLYSRMLEIVNKKQFTLDLNRFIPTQDRPEFWVWVTDQLEEYATKDMYMNPSYISKTDETLGVYWYQLEPQYDESQYLYYNMSPSIINYILQRIPFNVRFCERYKLAVASTILFFWATILPLDSLSSTGSVLIVGV